MSGGMSSRGWFALMSVAFALALAASAALFVRSRAADFDRHSQVVDAIGRVRNLDRVLSERVLSARFGQLNQYDDINETASDLAATEQNMALRIRAVVGAHAEVERALTDLESSLLARRLAVERFKRENALLRNSTYYLPTSAGELGRRLVGRTENAGVEDGRLSVAIQRVAQTGLAYNLIGDQSSRSAHLLALAQLRTQELEVPDDVRASFTLFVAHAEVIARQVPTVDDCLGRATSPETGERLSSVELAYDDLFGRLVSASNRYRRILYGWSLILLVGIAVAGVQLRRVHAGLEQRVADRTAELRRALSALWGEMKLARKIQEALVPASPSLTDADIAALMKPTAEVGGDYYDVIRLKDCEWILIGDVSGHGVPAGLVMMMCHTAVRTVLRCHPDIAPDGLLSLVNEVLVENLRQLQEDRYMTISAFRRDRDGTLQFAGAHQDVHVYRAGAKGVETIPSQGVWLGLKHEIGPALTLQQIRLEPGDVMLLHTDGVTEAARGGDIFDVAGLRGVLGRAGTKSAGDLVAEVFAALESFQITDDATVIALKQSGPAA